jgi:uncharacterized protein YbaR (Trm112 family)
MRPRLLDLLACPACRGELSCTTTRAEGEEIVAGTLACAACRHAYPIEHGIPRFVSSDNYAASFGLQWNLFKAEQIDAINGLTLSDRRFFAETEWPREWLRGKWILDAGCGAGRFLDVVSQAGAEVVGLDLSNAVDAATANLRGRPNVHLVQASLFELPFRPGVFDGCYCIGVIQHTPDPHRALRALPAVVRPGGRLAFFIYERKPWTRLYSKYLVRPITRRLEPALLLKLIRGSMPVLFPLTDVLFRVPGLGRLFQFAIPVSNYVGTNTGTSAGLSRRQRYAWAIMDTFDMLAPRYDQPQTWQEVSEVASDAGLVELRRTARYGLCFAGYKRAAPGPS